MIEPAPVNFDFAKPAPAPAQPVPVMQERPAAIRAPGRARGQEIDRSGVGVRQPQGRQALRPPEMEPLFDVPVSITNADQPIGTHVYTAWGGQRPAALDRGLDPEQPPSARRPQDRPTKAASAQAAIKPVDRARRAAAERARGARPHRHAAGGGRAHRRADHTRLVADHLRQQAVATRPASTPTSSS